MKKKIGEIFEHNGVTLITIEDKNNDVVKNVISLMAVFVLFVIIQKFSVLHHVETIIKM